MDRGVFDLDRYKEWLSSEGLSTLTMGEHQALNKAITANPSEWIKVFEETVRRFIEQHPVQSKSCL